MSKSSFIAVIGRRLIGILTAGIVAALFIPLSAAAITYSSGPYGTCGYASDCGPSTVVTVPAAPASDTNSTATPAATPTPLEVNINLRNGQVIPRGGYTIVVTPLNGKGTSFKEVEFYVNGSLVHSQTPDEQGTVSWFWNVGQLQATTIKVTVIGQDSQTVSKAFAVTIGNVTAIVTPAAAPSVLQQIVSAPKHILNTVTRSVSKLPKQVKYELPYFLFLLLGGDILLLFLRARQEITESRQLEQLLARERQVGELKHTFNELVSHYLRTPITIISGSLEIVPRQNPVAPAITSALGYIQLLQAAVEDLIAELSKDSSTSVTPTTTVTPAFWRQPSFFIPIGLIGIVALCFDYLARHAGGFNLSQINVIVQIVIFGSLTVITYQLLRRRHLRQRDHETTQRILESVVAFNKHRDQIIAYGATQIKGLVDKLAGPLSQIESPPAKKLAQSGLERLQSVTRKLTVANQLMGSQSAEPYSSVELHSLVHQALAGLESQVLEKSLQVKMTHDTVIQVQSEGLLVVVLHTLLDNAIAYSEPGKDIEVDANTTAAGVSISILDHGSGIPEDKQFSLFQAFSKTEGAETFNHEGMGFSLYLDKLIMNYLVGDIVVESAPNQGTKVILTLPLPA